MRNKIISVLMCFALSFLVLAPSYLAPKKVHAIAPAIPIVIGVGAVVASALAAYGISSVNSDQNVGDVGESFINWITSKNLDDFWDAQTDIKSAQAAIDAIYKIGLDGSMNLAEWTYNEQNAIYGVYGALLSMWAADNFGVAVNEIVTFNGYDLHTFNSSLTAADLVLNVPSSMNNQFSARPVYGVLSYGSEYTVFETSTNSYYDKLLLILGANGTWSLTYDNGSGYSRMFNSFSTASTYSDWVTGQNICSYVGNSKGYTFADLALNLNYPIRVYQSVKDLDTVYADWASHNFNGSYNPAMGNYENQTVGLWNPATGEWSGDVSISLPDEINYGTWDDSLSQGINDLLNNEIPVGSDMVYNPSLGALESQGSIPVTYDWSQVLDWADVLNGTRAGTLDGSQSIDGTTSTTAVNTATGTIATDIALDTALDIPYLSIDAGIGSIAGAMEFAGGQMLDHFPFCTIRDLQALAGVLNAPAQAPYFDLPLVIVENGSLAVITQRVSLAEWEGVAQVLRFMIGLLIVLGFIRVATRQLKVFNEE